MLKCSSTCTTQEFMKPLVYYRVHNIHRSNNISIQIEEDMHTVSSNNVKEKS